MIIHTVTQGETVYSIASRYGVSVELTIINNGLEGLENALPEGLGLVISEPSVTYMVRENDTTRSIATKFGVTLNDLYRRNLILQGEDLIFPGQTLVIEYSQPPIYDFDIGGYAYTSITDELLNETLPYMKLMMPFTYGFTASGEIVPLNDNRLLSRAFHYGTRVYFHLSSLTEDGTFSNELSRQMLASREVWPVLADNIIEIMEEKGYAGLDIDFEFLFAEEREIYPMFISYMRERMNAIGRRLIVALPPKTSSDQQGQLYEGVDYRLLGEAADNVLLMTYEYVFVWCMNYIKAGKTREHKRKVLRKQV